LRGNAYTRRRLRRVEHKSLEVDADHLQIPEEVGVRAGESRPAAFGSHRESAKRHIDG
jgi:hypothetical protein